MRKIKIYVIGLLLLLCFTLSCCGSWRNYFHTESSLKATAEKALEERYDEEFVIHDVWVVNQTSFYAKCSPVGDTDIVFEEGIYKDGRGVYKEGYVKGIVSKQISERLQPKLQEIFGECYIKVTFSGATPSIPYTQDVSVEDFYYVHEDASFYLQIFVNGQNLIYSKDRALTEFEYLSKLFDNEPMREAGVSCYFLDENRINECKGFFAENSRAMEETNEIIRNSPCFGFGYLDGCINKTFEEYDEVRREINTNE